MGDPHGRKREWLRKLFTRKRKPASGLPSETPSQSTSLPLHPSPAADNPPKTLVSAVARPIDPDPSPKSTPSIPTNGKPEDLWDRAEEELSNDKGKAEILEAYQEILRSQLGSELAARGTTSRHEQMSRLLNNKVEELERQKWRLHLGDHNIEVETLFSGVVRNILLAKDIVSSAALADPHAALACAGVSVILTLLIQPSEQRTALLQGLSYISTLICRFNVVEHVYRSRARIPSLCQEDAVRFEKEFEANLTTLYSQILEFQARALCHLSKRLVTQYVKDMFKCDDWDTRLEDIRGSESQCKGFKDLIDGEKLHKGHEEQKARIGELQQITNKIMNTLKEDKEEQKELVKKAKKVELLKKLYTSPYSDRKDRNPERVEGTCEWFTNHQRFRNWQESETSSLLWVSADPGCGKSVLAKYLVDTVLPSTTSRTTCYFFFKDDFEDQRSAVSALCCILRQLFIQNNPLLSDKILEKFETDGEKLIGSFRGLWDILLSAAEDHNAGEIICILDALDECKDEGRAQIAEALRELYGTRKKKFALKFLLTSRPYIDIQRDFQSLENRLPTIHLSGESEAELDKISREINVFIKSRVKDIGANLQLLPDEQKLLQDELTMVPNRTYLWVYLTLDMIRKGVNISRGSIRRGINEIPKTVEEAYDKILRKSHDSKKAMRLLHIIVAAARPLSLNEIALALAIKENHRTYDDLELELEPEVRFRATVRELCGLFVTIIDSKIYLLHQTAKEFLVQKETLDAANPNHESGHLVWKFSLRPADSNRILAEICIWYLLTVFETYPRGANQENDQSLSNHVFLDYSAKNWAAHFREANIRSDAAIVPSVLRICDPDTKSCSTWFKIYWTTINPSYPGYLTALIIASYFGLEGVVKQLLTVDGVDVNSKDNVYGRTALSWAAENGHEAVVKQLLMVNGVDVNSKDNEYSRTALSWAARNGHETVVRQLLAMDGVDINSKDSNGRTALSWLAGRGHEAVVKQLLTVDGVDVNSKDNNGLMALLWAAQNGHEAVVKQLLAVDGVDVNSKDNEYGRTALSWAARNGHEAVVQQLLAVDGVNVNSKDINGRTALSWLAGRGHEAVVKQLLTVDGVDVNSKDNNGLMALSWAAQNGHEAVVKQLFMVDGVDVNSKDKYNGRTALSWAARNGQEAVVKQLLTVNGVDINSKDSVSGRTALSWAARNGHEAVVKQLLAVDGVDVNSKDNVFGRTALSWAARNGHEAVVKQLLAVDGVDVNSKDGDGRTALSWLAGRGHEAVVKQLLAVDGVDVNSKDNYNGRTALSWAAEKGHKTVVKQLLAVDGIDVNSKDKYNGRTALSWAAEKGHKVVVKQLLAVDGIDINSKNKYNVRTALSWTAKKGHKAVVKQLLAVDGVHINSKDNGSGLMVLSWAAWNGHKAIVELL